MTIDATGPDAAAIARYITETFANVQVEDAYGYTMFFCGADRRMPFATLAARNNEFDTVSALDRPGIYRLNIGVAKETYRSLLGATPRPPGSSGVIDADVDFTALDRIMPHPHYGHMHWVCVLSPTAATFGKVRELLADAYALAQRRNLARES